MAKKDGSEQLDENIAELEAAIKEVSSCAACGKALGPDATTCPHCGTPVAEAQELQKNAAESLSELEEQLAETLPTPETIRTAREDSPSRDIATIAEALPAADVPTSELAPMVRTEAAPEPVPEPQKAVAEEAESGDLKGFIEEIEAEVKSAASEPEPAPSVTPGAGPKVLAFPRPTPSHGSSRWVAPVAAGAVMYVLSVFFVPLLDRILVASFMVIASVLVVTGIRAKPYAEERRGRRSAPLFVEDYVCPLCGTGISARATQCPTCGAVFED